MTPPNTTQPNTTPPATVPPITRRVLLRTSAVAGLGSLVLAACGGEGGGDGPATTPTGSTAPIDGDAEELAAIAAAGFADATMELTPINATFEVLIGPGRRMQIGVLGADGQPLVDAAIEVALVRVDDMEVVQRIDGPTYYGEGLGIRGVYVFETDLPTEAIYRLVVHADGSVGTTSLIARDPANSVVVPIGSTVPAVATPTVEDDQGLEELCTRDPDCTMHDVSLDTAVAEGRPVVLVVATPKYCTTAVCGPVVDVVEGVRDEVGRDDITWIHAEVFADAGNTPTQIVNALQLPSEPWTFLIDGEGTIVDRFDGPVVPALLRDAVAEHLPVTPGGTSATPSPTDSSTDQG